MVGTRQAEVLAELSADLEIVASEVQTLVILGRTLVGAAGYSLVNRSRIRRVCTC